MASSLPQIRRSAPLVSGRRAARPGSLGTSDIVDGSLPVTCTPTSGSNFPLGVTTVECSATDDAANTATGSFTVTVRDTTAPQLSLPGTITTPATSSSGAPVTFTATATDVVDGSVPVTCTPASGATFPLGSTTVSCTAADAAGNSTAGTFTVQVINSNPGFPAGGAFVIGNASPHGIGANVYFWGSQWAKKNSLSGGQPPSAFKGFEDQAPLPTCGGTWTSKPGNSSNPPPTVPDQMTVIVSGKITKSGSMITGDIKKIVVVRTGPGYGPSPGHIGQGQVVQVICSV